MNYKLRDFADDLIGKQLSDAISVRLSPDNRDNGHAFHFAACFQFDAIWLIFFAIADDDTVGVAKTHSLLDWIASKNEQGKLIAETDPILNLLIGQVFSNYWECLNDQGYRDAVDLGIGDINQPTLKLFCVASELHLLKIISGRTLMP